MKEVSIITKPFFRTEHKEQKFSLRWPSLFYVIWYRRMLHMETDTCILNLELLVLANSRSRHRPLAFALELLVKRNIQIQVVLL